MNRALLESNPLGRTALNAGRWVGSVRLRRHALATMNASIEVSPMPPARPVFARIYPVTGDRSKTVNAHAQAAFAFEAAHPSEPGDTRNDTTAKNPHAGRKLVLYSTNDFLRYRPAQTFELKLPSQLRTLFNGLQEQYGFAGRAGPR
jgi:hypothetical protein